MAKVFITGSADGLGLGAARILVDLGHSVTLHARNEKRAAQAMAALPEADAVLVADVSSTAEIRKLANDANRAGPFDAVIHNVAVYDVPYELTANGVTTLFAVNVLTPYLLTAWMARAKRLIYMSSGGHYDGHTDLGDPQWKTRAWRSVEAYNDSKLFDATLAFAVARRWPDVFSNAVDPGWAQTKMGGSGAPDDVVTGSTTQAWLAVSSDDEVKVSGEYFYKQEPLMSHQATGDVKFQDELLALCAEISGVAL